MVAKSKGSEIILDHQFGLDFCKILDSSRCKAKYLYLNYDGALLSVHVVSDTLTAYGSIEVQGSKPFKMGVPAPKFVALFKRLYPGSPIRLKPSKSSLTIQEDNIKVTLSASNYKAMSPFPEFKYIEGDECKRMVNAIGTCASALGDGKRFTGILIDNTSQRVGRVVNFTETAFRVCALPKFSFGDYRMVISIDVARSLKTLSDRISHVMVAPGKLGAYLSSNVCFYTPLRHDDLPNRYIESFNLLESEVQVDLTGRAYKFNKHRFAEVFEFVSSVIGAEESMILCEIEGLTAGTNFPVWRLSAKTYNGCEASELVESIAEGFTDMPACRVNKKSTVDSLKHYGDEIVVLDKDDTFLVITDSLATDITLLLKAPV